MEILQIIDEIEDVIDKGFNLFGYSMVNKENLMSLIDEVRLKLPDELKQAKWVKDERQRILSEAEKEAEEIINSTKEKALRMVDEHEIAQAAREKAQGIVEQAKADEASMMENALSYADSLLRRAEDTAASVLDEIRMGRNQLKR